MKKVLSRDGGGMMGLVSAKYESFALRDPLFSDGTDVADLEAGTSIGGIMALAAAMGIPANARIRFFLEYGPKIFKRPWFRHLRMIFRDRYSQKRLRKAIMAVLGDERLDSLTTRVMVTACDQAAPVREKALYLFRNESPFTVLDAALGTSAAPGYFKPYQKGNRVFLDGGIIANNPAFWAYAEARMLWPKEPLEIVSIGTGIAPGKNYKPPYNPLSALDDVIGLTITGGVGAIDYAMQALATEANIAYRRIDFPLDKDYAMDDASPDTMKALQRAAKGAKDYTVEFPNAA